MQIEEEVLNVKSAASFYSKIKDMIDSEEENGDVIIDLSRVVRVDLSIIQIIIAASREARKRGKMLKLKAVSAPVKEQMNLCGLKT